MGYLLFLYPWIELLTLIQLGVETSALIALGWVLLSLVLGGAMIRHAGIASVVCLQEAQRTGVLRQNLLVDDMALVIAGLLLIVPGLISDLFALVVLIGPLRRTAARRLFGVAEEPRVFETHYGDRSAGRHRGGESSQVHQRVTLEGEYQRVDEDVRDRSGDGDQK